MEKLPARKIKKLTCSPLAKNPPLRSLFDHFRASEVRGGGLLHPCLNPPPLFLGQDSQIRHRFGPLSSSKYQVFLRFYKVLGDLAFQKHIQNVKNVKFSSGFIRFWHILVFLVFQKCWFYQGFKGFWAFWTWNFNSFWPEMLIFPSVFKVLGLNFGSFWVILGPSGPSRVPKNKGFFCYIFWIPGSEAQK